MNVDELEKLLADFYEGKTDEKQEQQLKRMFEAEGLPEHLHVERELFLMRSAWAEEEVVVPPSLEMKLTRLIDERATEESQQTVRRGFSMTRLGKWTMAVAASVVLIATTIGLMLGGKAAPKDTFTDPEEAYKVLCATLMEVSVNLNSGIDQLSEASQEVARINKEEHNQSNIQ